MPGYTHLQRAQPVLLSHHLLAYYDMFQRDCERLAGCLERINVLPLGSGALAGTTFPIDRAYVAKLLGFPRISKNSIDAVSDRDFLLEFVAAAAILFVHLSRLADELVLWSSQEFGFIELPDGYCTGSSMMPQKKNPDVPELIRGKTGRVFGHLQALADDHEGIAAGLQSRLAGRQSSVVRYRGYGQGEREDHGRDHPRRSKLSASECSRRPGWFYERHRFGGLFGRARHSVSRRP